MPSKFEAPRLSALIGGFAGKQVLVIGDLMLDELIWGKVSRISPEAPVPVVSVTGESYYPGGAANVARKLREFTDGVAVMGACGEDAAGRRLLDLLHGAGIDTTAIQQDPALSTTVKTRIIARHQQVVRVDRDARAFALGIADVDRVIQQFDAVVVADYGKGFLTQPLADGICRAARAHGRILAVDPHPHTSLAWTGATARILPCA